MLNLEQYACRRCGRAFYIEAADRLWLDVEFGCPFGCDDNGRYVRRLRAEAAQLAEVEDDVQ